MSPDALEETYPALARLLGRQLELTPQHTKYLTARMQNAGEDHLSVMNEMAECVIRLCGRDLDTVLLDYDWICKAMLREEIEFRRSGEYRLKTFQQAVDEVYSDQDFMSHYMNGLLISQVWWANHAEALRFYKDKFLGGFARPFDHLEIGPGHGLLLYFATEIPACRTLEAWDVSEASVEKAEKALQLLGLGKPVTMRTQDLFAADASAARFDSIVFSEVLEHLDRPADALRIIRSLLKADGRLYINMPINSPAPDHLFLLRTPEAVVEFVESCGYTIEQSQFEPQTGMTLERARRMEATISVLLIARPG